MNVRKGIKRLAIALGVLWFGWWGFVGISNFRNYNTAVEKGDLHWMNMTLDNLVLAIVWGALAPIVLLIVLAAAYWVWRGFKPKREAPE